MFKEFSGALPHQKFDENLQKKCGKINHTILKTINNSRKCTYCV